MDIRENNNKNLYTGSGATVSVILPAYNRADVIMRAVSSVIRQNFNEWELIIVDDGSDDNTFSLLDKFILGDQRIRYIKHKNRKIPASLNTGLKMAEGKYITFLGSDDEYGSNHLSSRTDFMEQNPDTDFIHGGVKIIGDPYVKDKNNLEKKVHLKDCIVGGTIFGKKNSFLRLNGFRNLQYSEDSDLLERATENGFTIKKVEWPTYIYCRDSEDSICNNI